MEIYFKMTFDKFINVFEIKLHEIHPNLHFIFHVLETTEFVLYHQQRQHAQNKLQSHKLIKSLP